MQIENLVGTSLTMTSLEIAGLTEKRHDNVMADIRKMLAELQGDGGVLGFQDTQTNLQNGQAYPIFRLPKRETLILVSGYSVTMRARIIDRWQQLEAQVAKPVAITMSPLEELTRDVQAIADFLRVDGTSRSAMLQTMLRTEAPRYLPLLPAYATNAPRTSDGRLLGGEGNSEAAYAATSLLKKLGATMTIHQFNKRAEDFGFLEVCERPSSKHLNVQRVYRAISAKGREFGYNLSNEHSKGSVQPVWFESKFGELLNIIK